MRRAVRFAVGATLGGSALSVYLLHVGVDEVVRRATAVAPWAVALVFALVVLEALADSIGVWASVKPLGDGLSPGQSVQFALAGDFFDTLSPAGPVSSEPIMARFFGVATETTYSEALGVRGLAKYVKAAAQLALSTVLVGVLLVGGVAPQFVATTLVGAVLVLLVVGVALVRGRVHVSKLLVIVFAPVVTRLSALYRDQPHDRDVVADAVERLWARALHFRGEPGLVGLIVLGGLLEQVLTAGALWVALSGTGTAVALVPIVVVMPLPQAASMVPVPASLGAYDLLLAGALVVMTGAPLVSATAAVLVVRLFGLLVALAGGGLATGFLRGWRP
ncbi:lysylphosphatidylglycerol synthase domain-containing protein [Halarchaeum sp. P4]|uniref:lysylphosphatidylglycerol synthase domain-containing protein n=1 Tax=Halarchaeum sp. P4 TaxID=3421639 RepID=UPI003EBB6928